MYILILLFHIIRNACNINHPFIDRKRNDHEAHSKILSGLMIANAFATNGVRPPHPLDGNRSKEHASFSAHLDAIESYQAQLAEMNNKIQLHKIRLAQLNNKPYMDPKGFQRFAARMLSSHLKTEMEKLEQRIAWHLEQIRQSYSSSYWGWIT